jgi:CRP-like cAMP-binding protein
MTIEDDIALLERVPTFALLGRDALRVLAIGAESRTLQEGEVLFHEGEPADCGYVVEEGMLTARGRGRDAKPVALSRGTLIGEFALLAHARRRATVAATAPCSVMRIPRALFLKMQQGYPEMAARLRQSIAGRSERMVAELGAVRDALVPGAAAGADALRRKP